MGSPRRHCRRGLPRFTPLFVLPFGLLFVLPFGLSFVLPFVLPFTGP